MRGCKFDHQLIEPLGGYSRLDVRNQQVERAGRELARPAHALEGITAMELDLGIARLGAEDV